MESTSGHFPRTYHLSGSPHSKQGTGTWLTKTLKGSTDNIRAMVGGEQEIAGLALTQAQVAHCHIQ